MAKTKRKATKRGATADRGAPRARKSVASKARKPGLRKPKPAETDPDKQKSSLPSETARLKRQLKAARMHQEASAEILRAVANASGDAAGPLQLIAETTARLFTASSVAIQLAEDGEFTQEYRVGAIAKRVGAAYPRSNIKVGGRNLPGTVVAENRQIHIPDLDHLDPSMSDFPGLPHARAGGARTVCGTPLRREHKALGALIVFRDRLLPFTGQELALQQSFADQAVIAIENARLFNETQEALGRQTATADILRIISRSVAHAAPVFDTILESCQRLFNPYDAAVYLVEGEGVRGVARRGPGVGDWGVNSMPLAGSSTGLAIAQRRPLHFPDLADKADLPEDKRDAVRLAGGMSVLYAPIISESRGVGSLVVTRQPKKPFTETEIEFIQSFADQAAIAIENARLFNETQEALERQTATADILKVIASSPSDVQPVFEAIAERSNRLVGGLSSAVYAIVENVMHLMAFTRTSPEADAAIQASFPRPLSEAPWADQIRKGEIVEIPDAEIEWADHPALLKMVRLRGFRGQLLVPLLRDGTTVGLISVTRKQPGTFAPHHVQLLQSFADQAVIAIENVRLFDEVQNKTRDLTESLQQQTATADVLRVISRSAFELEPALVAVCETAARLCDADQTAIFQREGELYRFAACSGFPPEYENAWRAAGLIRNDPTSALAGHRAVAERRPVHILDVTADPAYPATTSGQSQARTSLGVPLMRDGEPIGNFVLARRRVEAFSDRQLELIQTFADQAVIAIENTRLFNETKEALEQQTATAEILSVMSSSPTDVTPVFEAIAERARELSGSRIGSAVRFDGELLHMIAFRGSSPEAEAAMHAAFPMKPGNGSLNARVIAGLVPLQIPDIGLDPAYQLGDVAKKGDYRALLAVPMIHDGRAIGAIGIGRDEPGLFPEKIVTLLQTFASQAVIAIENVRLFNETREALERQTATSEVLAVISRSPSDLNPVLQAISDTAARLCGSEQTIFFRYDGDVFRILASWNFPPEVHEMLERRPLMPGHPSAIGRAGASLKPVCIPDVLADPAYGLTGEQNRARYRATLAVPLLREGRLIGALSLNRSEPGAFTEKQIALVATFADQAVIAIENVRLFDEVQAKTRDLSEALTYQTGSANILNVIASSPTDVAPVLKAIVESACEVCEAYDAAVLLRDGDDLRFSAHHGPIPIGLTKWPINRRWTAGRAFIDQQPVHIEDLRDEKHAEFSDGRELSLRMGHRTIASVPLLREKESVGAIVLRRVEVHPFSGKQIALLQTFADQAVIALGNVRLFEEVQAKTRDLEESLQQQIATADVLKVISRSAFDLQTVLETLARSAVELSAARRGTVFLRDGDLFRFRAASHPDLNEDWIRFMKDSPQQSGRHSTVGRAIASARSVCTPDVDADPEIRMPTYLAGIRAVLAVPLLRDGRVEGVMAMSRQEPGEFTARQIELVETFADQAVIAIQNTRLFNETREALERQTATAEILKVIAGSPDDVQPVFQAIAERSNQLVGGFATTVVSIIADVVHLSAFTLTTPAADAAMGAFYPRPLSGFTYGDAVRRGEIHRIVDAEVELAGDTEGLAMVRRRGWRSALWVPLLLEGEAIGVIGVTRVEPGPFADHHVEMLKTFADQAVIAISNVNLFRQVQERTRELSQSLDDLRTAQDRLVQTEKLASLGQLTAGIAHEIKNPLNFVNNFSALSVELIDEMTEIFENPTLDEAGRRKELDEIRELLKSNLEKVVQHGKRADSIVKNMLLHSREGSGEQRAVDINALLDESLNLAYHGARAEKPGFNITLRRDLDPDAGVIELFPQEITRALLNLISNGFYAASKREAENGEAAFEPALSAATKNLGNHIEIRIRDNGTGIPPEVKEKMFNPFFTTKPAGEGTGLGLSMSHDIIVKQHGGRIEVDTEPGQFTEFTIVLPRASTPANNRKN